MSLLNLFVVLSKEPDNHSIKKLSLNRSVQRELTEKITFIFQSWKKLDGVAFSSDYKLEPDEEIFYIENHSIDNSFIQAVNIPKSIETFNNEDFEAIQFIFSSTPSMKEIFFQNFDKRSILSKNKISLLLDAGTFSRMDKKLLVFPENLAIVFNKGKNKLFFKSFHNANKIINISNYLRTASNKELNRFLDNKVFFCEEKTKILDKLNAVSKKNIGRIIDEDILNKVSASKIRNVCKKYGLNVSLKNKQVVFPTAKRKLNVFFKILNEDYFEATFTGNKYKTNSKRKLK